MSGLFYAQRINILLLILCWLGRTNAIFKLTNVVCSNEDESFMHVAYCRLKAVRRDVAEFSARANLLKTVRDCTLRVEYLRRYNGYKPFLFNTTVDACWFLNIYKTNKDIGIMTILFNTFGKYTNFNHSCPYEGSVFIEKFAPTHADFPNLPWPTGDYMVRVSFSIEKKLRARVQVYFTFTEIEQAKKKIKRNRSN